jgi:hypothetical protein
VHVIIPPFSTIYTSICLGHQKKQKKCKKKNNDTKWAKLPMVLNMAMNIIIFKQHVNFVEMVEKGEIPPMVL